MKSFFLKTSLVACSVYLLTACSDTNMRFLASDADTFKAETPADGWIPGADPIPVVDPTPVVAPSPVPDPTPVATPTPVVVIPTPIATPVVVVPIATPSPVAQDDCVINGLSQKACYLMKIMELGCPLRDHRPANYQAPSRAQIIANMDRCDANIYPTTTPTAAQLSVIQRLIDPNDARFRNYIFTGLYYKPPYTDDFKKYFGIELYDAEYVFCDNWGIPPGAGYLLPRSRGDRDVVLDKDYKAANVYAGQLNQCVAESKAH